MGQLLRKSKTTDAQFVATAYHEAGHAVIGMIIGFEIEAVCVNDDHTGYCKYRGSQLEDSIYASKTACQKRVPAELVKYWRNRYLCSDAGEIAEYELAPMTGIDPRNFSHSDRLSKESCEPNRTDSWRARRFYKRYFQPFDEHLYEECADMVRRESISKSITWLAETLLRKPKLNGIEVVDLLLANRFNQSKQLDLFWEAIDDRLI